MLSATKTRKQYRNKKMRKKALKSAYKSALNMKKGIQATEITLKTEGMSKVLSRSIKN